MYKLFTMMLFILGITLVTASISKSIGEQNPRFKNEKIIYRYIPRTLIEEQEEPVFVSEIFATMFSQPSTWLKGMNDLDNKEKTAISVPYLTGISSG
jgi:hypothetical protein